jgi:FemAB-related protein (PEP-CTERM system-associated)
MSDTIVLADPHAGQVHADSRWTCRKCHVTTASPQLFGEWDAYVSSHLDGTLFHTSSWCEAVRETFRHEPVYLAAIREDRIVGALPLVAVGSLLAGRMLVSVPYGVGGGIVADDKDAALALFDAAKALANERRCAIIDLRSERAVAPGLPVVERYVGFRRGLPENVGDVLGWLPRKARAAARNARNKYRLEASFDDAHLSQVWRLYSISMRRLGSLNYPFAFFEQLIARTPGRHWVSIVRWENRPVAGLVTFLFKDRVMPYFIGTTDEAKRCSAANFIYLTLMERGVQCGYRVFDFGRSRRDNTGSYDFKRFNGFEPQPLQYQRYTASGHSVPDVSPSNPRFRLARCLWRRLPLCVTRTIGSRLARHVPG